MHTVQKKTYQLIKLEKYSNEFSGI